VVLDFKDPDVRRVSPRIFANGRWGSFRLRSVPGSPGGIAAEPLCLVDLEIGNRTREDGANSSSLESRFLQGSFGTGVRDGIRGEEI
jgi:hypothetical protein